MGWKPWLVVFAATLILTTLKSIRPPISYPATLYLFNYEEGFIKRGLFGSLVFAGDGSVSLAQITLIAFAILGVLLFALIVIAAWMIRDSPEIGPLAILFASSISIVYLASTTAYFDHLLLILAILAILPGRAGLRAIFTLGLGIIAILIHEAAALMILPLMYFSVFLACQKFGTVRSLSICVSIFAIHTALTVYVSYFGTMSTENVVQFRESLEMRTDFPLASLAFSVLTVSPTNDMVRVLEQNDWVDHLDSLVIVAPSLLPILIITGIALRQLKLHSTGMVWMLWIAACLSPATLRFLGTDIHRWDAITVCTSFLSLFLVQRELPQFFTFGLTRNWITPLLILMIVISASTTTDLFWDQNIRLYPFFELRDVIQ